MTKKQVDELFFQLFCEKNSDGTRHLRLRGKELFLRFGYRLNHTHMLELAYFLTSNPEVESLDLSYNDIGDEGMKILVQYYFDSYNTMKSINLLHCDIGHEGIKFLADAQFLNLRVLKLTGNKFGVQGTRHVGTIVDRCKELEDLDIGETDQTNISIEELLMIIENSDKLKSLNISRIVPKTYYSKYNTDELADDISILMKLNNSLEVLRMQKCGFDGHDMDILIDGIISHPNLLMLDLEANRFGDHGVTFICKWLKTRPNLIGLRLAANDISSTGANFLALSLPFSKIRYLDLQKNRISQSGVLDILYSIKKSTKMRIFYMWGNELSVEVLRTLEKLLKADILEQEYIDVKIYYVDGQPRAAYYPTNDYVNNSYNITNFPRDLKIVRNKVFDPNAKPRALVNFDFMKPYIDPVHPRPPKEPENEPTPSPSSILLKNSGSRLFV